MYKEELARIATLYYIDGLTQEELSRMFSISRATVGRMLRRALQEGIVEIRVRPNNAYAADLERALVERFGGGPPRATIGCFCGTSASNANQAAFFDLDAADPADLLAADDATIFAAVDATPKIIRSLATNKSPALLTLPNPSPVHIQRAEVIARSPDFRSRVGKALAARFPQDPAAPPPPVEKQIFGGFYSHADKALLTEFQRADWLRRQEIAATLTDARLRQLGRRLVALHAPALLSPKERGQFDAWLRERWFAPNAPDIEWTGLAKAQAALGELRAKAGVDQGLVGEIEAYLKRFEL